jgi:hypothetical protein
MKQQNARLREEVAYLNSKCEEFLLDKNDDALVAVFKRKINMLENNLEDTENEYEEKLTMYKKKYNEAQRENLELQKRIRDLGFEDATKQLRESFDRKIKEYDSAMELKDKELAKEKDAVVNWEEKYKKLKQKAKDMLSKAKGRARSKEEVGGDQKSATRFKIKSRPGSSRSRSNSRRGSFRSESLSESANKESPKLNFQDQELAEE